MMNVKQTQQQSSVRGVRLCAGILCLTWPVRLFEKEKHKTLPVFLKKCILYCSSCFKVLIKKKKERKKEVVYIICITLSPRKNRHNSICKQI